MFSLKPAMFGAPFFLNSQTDIARGFLKWIAGGFPPAATNGQSPQGKQL